MRKRHAWASVAVVGVVLTVALVTPKSAEASIFIHEILADPAAGPAGDANQDGVRDSYDDEFVELFNLSSGTVDISGWILQDAVGDRHVFGAGTMVQANSAFVLFGGGNPNLPGIDWQVAGGSLNLNNGGDTVFLRDAAGLLVDSYTYGSEAGDDQSITRSPEGSAGVWIKHTELINANGVLFSPGYLINDSQTKAPNAVPEPASLLTLLTGISGCFAMKKKVF